MSTIRRTPNRNRLLERCPLSLIDSSFAFFSQSVALRKMISCQILPGWVLPSSSPSPTLKRENVRLFAPLQGHVFQKDVLGLLSVHISSHHLTSSHMRGLFPSLFPSVIGLVFRSRGFSRSLLFVAFLYLFLIFFYQVLSQTIYCGLNHSSLTTKRVRGISGIFYKYDLRSIFHMPFSSK